MSGRSWIAAMIFIFLISRMANAAVILNEQFDYADGSDITNVSLWSGTGSGTVTGGVLSASGVLTLEFERAYSVNPAELFVKNVPEIWFRYTVKPVADTIGWLGIGSTESTNTTGRYAATQVQMISGVLSKLGNYSLTRWTNTTNVPSYTGSGFVDIYGRVYYSNDCLKLDMWFNPVDPQNSGNPTLTRTTSYIDYPDSKMIDRLDVNISSGSFEIDSVVAGTQLTDVLHPYTETNYAAGTTIQASSYSSATGWGREKVNDGIRVSTNTSCGWMCNHPANTSEWIRVDMGSNKLVGRVDLYPVDVDPSYPDGVLYPVDFSIQTSTNLTDWVTVASVTNAPQPGAEMQRFDFSGQLARYVRVYITNKRYNTILGTYRTGFAEMEVYPPVAVSQEVWIQPAWSRLGNLYEPGETASLSVLSQPLYDLCKVNIKGPWVVADPSSGEASVATKDGFSCLKLQWTAPHLNSPIRCFQFNEPFFLNISHACKMRFQVYAETAGNDLKLCIQDAADNQFFSGFVGTLVQGWNTVTVPLNFERDKIIDFEFDTRWNVNRTFYIRNIEFVGLRYERPQEPAQLQVTLEDESGVQFDQFSTTLTSQELRGNLAVPLEFILPSANGVTYAELRVISADGKEVGYNRVPFGTSDMLLDATDQPLSNRMGVAIHLSVAEEGDPELRMDLAKKLGMYWLRGGLGIVSDSEGQYDWTVSDLIMDYSVSNGMDYVFVMNPPDWAFDNQTLVANPAKYQQYVNAVAGRYPTLHVWELGNEPNLSTLWATNEAKWVAFTATGYGVLKSNDVSHTVINGALNHGVFFDGWIETVFASGLGTYIDDLSLHTYGYSSTQWPYSKELMASYGYPNKGIWLTETAINLYGDSGAPARESRYAVAQSLVERYLFARKEGLKLFSWYELVDGNFGTGHGLRQKSLGLFEFNGNNFSPKETAMAFHTMTALFEDYAFAAYGVTNSVVSFRFAKGSGETLTAYSAFTPKTTSVFVGTGTPIKVDIYGNRTALTPQSGIVNLQLTEDYIFLIIEP